MLYNYLIHYLALKLPYLNSLKNLEPQEKVPKRFLTVTDDSFIKKISHVAHIYQSQ